MTGFRNNQIARVKALFFDQQRVLSAVDKATMWVFRRFGQKVRGRARASIKPPPAGSSTVRFPVPGSSSVAQASGPVPAAPGLPPHAQANSPLRKFIWFSLDNLKNTVVIGPVRLTRTRAQRASVATEALEYGGPSVHTAVRYFRTGARGGVHRETRDFRVSIRPHPFMRPAFDRTVEKDLDKLWRNCVKA